MFITQRFICRFMGSLRNRQKDVIHLQRSGSIYRTINVNPTCYSEYLVVGANLRKDDFYFNIKDKNYYGKVMNNSLEIMAPYVKERNLLVTLAILQCFHFLSNFIT